MRETVARSLQQVASALEGESERERRARQGIDPDMTRDELEDYQDERVSAQVNHAYNNTGFYRDLLDSEGLDPEDIQTVEDLSQIPPTTGDDLAEAELDFPNYPFLATGWDDVARVNESSGTSGGAPKQVMMSYDDQQSNAEEQMRLYGELGLDESDTVLNVFPFSLNTSGFSAHTGLEELGVNQLTAGVMLPPEKHAQLTDEYEPEAMMALPSYASRFTDVLKQQGMNPAESSIEHVIIGGEAYTDEQLEILEEEYDAQVSQVYGMTEVGGISGGEFQVGNGMHIFEDGFVFEVVDPETYERVEDGEDGEILFTPLNREAVPLLRYAPGDMTSVRTDEDEFDTSFQRIETPWRKHDVADIEGVEIYPNKVGERILDIDEELKEQHGVNGEFKITLDYDEDISQYQMDVEVESVEQSEEVEEMMKSSLFEILEFSSIDSQTVADISVDMVNKGELQTKGKAERIELTDDYKEFKGWKF